jgi:DNA-binding transcriptional MerR regulator
MPMETYSIGETARLTGVSEKQLRNWERSKYIPELDRIIYGDVAYRRFDTEQVRLIQEIKKYLDDGYTLSAASQKARQR